MVDGVVQTDKQFKFLTGELVQSEKHEGVTAAVNCDSDGIAGNSLYSAVPWCKTGTIAVFGATTFGRYEANQPLIQGHRGNVTDLAFSPFEERLLATTGDDGMAKLWVIEDPKGIVTQTDEADIELQGHTKNCKGLAWHTSVENCLATFALDQTVQIWDINEGKWDSPILSTTLDASPTTCAGVPTVNCSAACSKTKR